MHISFIQKLPKVIYDYMNVHVLKSKNFFEILQMLDHEFIQHE